MRLFPYELYCKFNLMGMHVIMSQVRHFGPLEDITANIDWSLLKTYIVPALLFKTIECVS